MLASEALAITNVNNYKNDAVNRELVIVHSDKFTEVVGKNIEYENEQRKKKCCDCENCETCCGKC